VFCHDPHGSNVQQKGMSAFAALLNRRGSFSLFNSIHFLFCFEQGIRGVASQSFFYLLIGQSEISILKINQSFIRASVPTFSTQSLRLLSCELVTRHLVLSDRVYIIASQSLSRDIDTARLKTCTMSKSDHQLLMYVPLIYCALLF
jgi:hypothetical protein